MTFDAFQISIYIADQEALELVLPVAREKEIGLIAKRRDRLALRI